MSLEPLFATLGNIIGALGNVKSAAVLREHVALLKSKMMLIEQRMVDLEKECADLREQRHELTQELARYRVAGDFVENRGAAFKRKAAGAYGVQPYCPDCHSVMASEAGPFLFKCVKCGKQAAFTRRELPDVLKEVAEGKFE